MTVRSKAWFLGRSLAGFESRRQHGYLYLFSVVCCQVEISAMGRSLVQRSPTVCGVSEWNRKDSIRRMAH
jgi:hypothetical protein